ncbi:MAG: hypothetical protein AAFN50_10000 [Pseudomonadota bacterium]
MRDPDFNALAQSLLESGIAPRHAHRTVNELRDHYDDLIDAAVDDGMGSKQARAFATEQLGSMDTFVHAMQSRRELKTWAFRYPRVALVIYPIACLVALPAMPVVAGFAHRMTLARWGASLLAAGFVVVATMLGLQLAILFG